MKRTALLVILAVAITTGGAIAAIYYGYRCDGEGDVDRDWGCISTGYQQWDCLPMQINNTNGCLTTNQNWRCETSFRTESNVVWYVECLITTNACAVIDYEMADIDLWICDERFIAK